jgi:hypothetical protein
VVRVVDVGHGGIVLSRTGQYKAPRLTMSQVVARWLMMAGVRATTRQSKRRHVVLPATEPQRGTIWGYGVRTLAKLTGKTQETIHNHVRRGDFDPCDLKSVACWLLKHMPEDTGAVPSKGWQPIAPNLSDSVIAGLIANSPRLVRSARQRGHFDPADPLSVAAWIYERRRWAKPVPSRQFERYLLVQLPAVERTGVSERVGGRRNRRLDAVRRALQELGFKNAEVRGAAHIFVKPDFLPLAAAKRLATAMNAEGLRASDLTLRQRRRLALGPSIATSQRGGSRVKRES